MSSDQPQSVSQLTLMKVASKAHKCQVYCELDTWPQMFQIPIDESTSVQSVMNQVVLRLRVGAKWAGVATGWQQWQLYAARKDGRKVSDLPSLSSQQKILNTGIKRFYLECKQQKKKTMLGSASTKSISSEMNVLNRQPKEKAPPRQYGCFCFS